MKLHFKDSGDNGCHRKEPRGITRKDRRKTNAARELLVEGPLQAKPTMADFWINHGWFKVKDGSKKLTRADWRMAEGIRRDAVRFLVEKVLGKEPRDITLEEFHSNRLRGLLNGYYNDSPCDALKEAGYEILPWEMLKTPNGFYKSKENRVAAIMCLVKKLDKAPSDVVQNDFYSNRLGGLLSNYYDDSPYAALKEAGLVTAADEAYMCSTGHMHGEAGNQNAGHNAGKPRADRADEAELLELEKTAKGCLQAFQTHGSGKVEAETPVGVKMGGLLSAAFGKDKRGRHGRYHSATDAELLEEAKKYSGRSDCRKNNYPLYYKLWKGHLLGMAFGNNSPRYYKLWKGHLGDRAFGKDGRYHSATDAELLEEAKKYSGRTDCSRKDRPLYRELLKREKASDAAYPRRTGWKSEQIIEYGGIEGLRRLGLDELRKIWQEWQGSDNRKSVAGLMDNLEVLFPEGPNSSREWLIAVLSWEWHVADLADALCEVLDELQLKRIGGGGP